MNQVLLNIIRFIILFILQVLLVDNLQFMGWCYPAIYILFLILLPINLPRWAELFIGFIAGFLMDIFCNTLGIHMAACTFIAFLRPIFIHRLVADKERILDTPSSSTIGFVPFFKIVIYLTFIFHFILFTLEAFSLHNWWITLIQIILSSTIAVLVFLIYDLFKR